MQLKVTVGMWGESGLAIDEQIVSFDDAERIGVRVGRAVRDFLRHVPMTRNGAHTQIDIRAAYEEGKPRSAENGKPRRRKKVKVGDDAAE